MSKKTTVKVKTVGKDKGRKGCAYISPRRFDQRAQQMNTQPNILVQMEDGSFQIFAATDLTRRLKR